MFLTTFGFSEPPYWDSDVANLEGLILEPDDLGGSHLELEQMEQLRLKKLLAWLLLQQSRGISQTYSCSFDESSFQEIYMDLRSPPPQDNSQELSLYASLITPNGSSEGRLM